MKYTLITFGCQMNKNDSERVAAVMERLGFERTPHPHKSDCIIINTCSVRQTAEDRVFGQMKNFARFKEEKPDMILVVTGCMPGRDHDGSLRKKLPMVDFFFPIANLPQLPRLIAGFRPEIAASFDLEDDYFKIQPLREQTRQAFVSISSGCDNFCTFCVVPYARGRERCRQVSDLLGEIRHLAENGCVEVTLLGQNVNTYHPDDPQSFRTDNPFLHRSLSARGAAIIPWRPKTAFAALLWEVNQIPGIERIHFTAPNPQDMTDAVIEALALPKQVNYLHLPVQSGSDRILQKMNRRYTHDQYLDIIERVKRVRPEIALGTDIIVGFCTETDADFQETLRLYREVDFDISYNAMYSSRSGTAAGRFWKDDVPKTVKKERWNALHALMEDIVLKKNQAYVGKSVEVLVDTFENPKSNLRPELRSREIQMSPVVSASGGTTGQANQAQNPNAQNTKQGLCVGNSREMKRVQFRGDKNLVGQLVNVEIIKAKEWVLHGRLVIER